MQNIRVMTAPRPQPLEAEALRGPSTRHCFCNLGDLLRFD